MNEIKHLWQNLATVLIVALLAFGGWELFGPKVEPTRLAGVTTKVKHLNVVGVGDSLTHGVGDATNAGGYVALIKRDLEQSGDYTVSTSNFGVTGNTAPQVQHRLDTQLKLQKAVKQANIITLTVGGNDLMAVLQKHFFDMTTKDVANGNTQFQKRLAKLVATLRKDNPKAPIYVFGIYNPFYVYFPNLTAMTTSVQNWNAATKKTLATIDHAYYVDIDSVLSKGNTSDKSKATKQALKDAVAGDSNANPLIFTQDHFHPNNAGYAQMTKQLWHEMTKTKQQWEQ
ncbi:SGNH/GDSL hydrolase family protein [Lacticaseibacillus porcinae]|uniref:SGNH/GDSL hydrolase family protein n=1 Tax=Lacticaseibacillus porcinae TaxID=1123687 RepID=UPI000F7AC676|nr:SGNH/GDSL hydrolase family protein [Lacticaseibacillus porcinae]